MLRGGVHCINSASSIFLFNIYYGFAFVKMMYFGYRNKQFEGKKTRLPQVNNNKKNKSQFYFPVVSFSCGRRVCKTSIQKTMALIDFEIKHIAVICLMNTLL